MPSDKYDILGVSRTATTDEIRQAYLRLARTNHPDLNPGNDRAESHFKAIQLAYETLVDPIKRRDYDLSGHVPSPVVYAEEFWQAPDFYWPEHNADSEFHLVRRTPLSLLRNGIVAVLCLAILGSAGYGFYWMANTTARAAAIRATRTAPTLGEPFAGKTIADSSASVLPNELTPTVGGIPLAGLPSMSLLTTPSNTFVSVDNRERHSIAPSINLNYWESIAPTALWNDNEYKELEPYAEFSVGDEIDVVWGMNVSGSPFTHSPIATDIATASGAGIGLADFSTFTSTPTILSSIPPYTSPAISSPHESVEAQYSDSSLTTGPLPPVSTAASMNGSPIRPSPLSGAPALTARPVAASSLTASSLAASSLAATSPMTSPVSRIPDTSLAPQLRQGRANLIGQNAEFFMPTPRSSFSSLNQLSTSLPNAVLSNRLRSTNPPVTGGKRTLPQIQSTAPDTGAMGSQGHLNSRFNGTYSSPGMSVVPSTPTFPIPSRTPVFQPVN